MPSYDYKCSSCNYEFEEFHSMSAKPLKKCPECGKLKLIKLIGPGVSIIIKGTKNPCRGERSNSKKTIKRRDKLGQGKNKTDKPFWRDSPVDKNILKNPKKYIEEGKV